MSMRPSLRTLAVVCMSTTLGATAATIVAAQDRHDAECDVRRAVVDGFDFYTDALVAANQPETPEERMELKQAERAFRADLAVKLAPIEAGC